MLLVFLEGFFVSFRAGGVAGDADLSPVAGGFVGATVVNRVDVMKGHVVSPHAKG